MAEPKSNRPCVPRVALLVETQGGAGRDSLRGIARYVRESGPWALHHDPRTEMFTEGWFPTWLKNWKGSGIIGRFETDAIVNVIKELGIPAIDLLGVRRDLPFPQVLPDNDAIGRLAAQHLLERGFRQFGYIGWRNESWSEQRRRAFQDAVTKQGCECSILQVPNFKTLPESWDDLIEHFAEWIRQQPKPLGLMLCFDHVGPPVTQACRQIGVAVPEEVAIIGVDNSEVLCEICDPPLSSVSPNHEGVGYEGAALLDAMMNGAEAPTEPVIIPPRGVIVRQSTSISAIEDPVVSAAMSMIREHACNGLQVSDVAEHMPVSRSVLQRRFLAVLGRSVHNEILRVQLRKAQDLLRETDLTVRSVAEKSGFKHPEYMAAVFKSRLGLTPGQYRKRYQPASTPADDEPVGLSDPDLAL
jgi:LacI family transcriptional regulator